MSTPRCRSALRGLLPDEQGQSTQETRLQSHSGPSPDEARSSGAIAPHYSAATGGATLGELAEWDAEFVAPFAAGAFISARGLSERRDFPSK
jgi:hypothetical protein